MKKIALLIYVVIAFIPALGQSAADILGRWEGKHFIGTEPSKRPKSYGGVSDPPIYDSTYQLITIEKLNGDSFTGTVYEYFISDPAGSYMKGIASGTVNGREIHFNAVVSKDNKLTKYPGMWWCMLPADAVITKKETVFEMIAKTGPSSCITGDARLTKKIDDRSSPSTVASSPAGEVIIQPGGTRPPASIPAEKTNTVTEAFTKRRNSITKTIEVVSGKLQLMFYDNGTVDGDSISVFINGKLTETHKRLSYVPLIVQLTLDKNLPFNEVAMFAENLGTIPPNTALMVVKDADKSFDIFLSSDKTSNAVLRIKQK